jgi:hypothetical protein
MPSLPCVVAFSLVDLKTFGPLALRSSPFYLVHPPPPFWPSGSLSRWRTIQNSNGVFSVVARGQAKFVQHFTFRLTICFAIPPIDNSEILPFPLAPQMNPPQILFVSGYILNGATLSPLVTFLDGAIRLRYALLRELQGYGSVAPIRAALAGRCRVALRLRQRPKNCRLSCCA